MKREYLSFFLVFLVVLIFVASDFAASARSPQTEKPKEDYMTTILSRNTKPLGLKDNPVLKKYLSQPSIKWVVRSVERHILE